jgi:RNAse (barnase) inhibitor barstar
VLEGTEETTCRKREEAEEENARYNSLWDIWIIKVSLPVFMLIVHLMKIQHLQFACGMKHEVCVCVMWEMENNIFHHFKILAPQYAETSYAYLFYYAQ